MEKLPPTTARPTAETDDQVNCVNATPAVVTNVSSDFRFSLLKRFFFQSCVEFIGVKYFFVPKNTQMALFSCKRH